MSSILTSDIFFFITSAVVVLVGILLATICVYVLVILRNVRETVRVVRREADMVASGIRTVRSIIGKFINVDKKSSKK